MKKAEKLKKGDILFEYQTSVEAWKDNKLESSMYEWHVTNVDSRGVYLKCKNSSTWGKLSRKNGDYGWLPNTWYGWKKNIKSGEELKDHDLYTTKRAAYRSQLRNLKKTKAFVSRLITKIEKM